MDKIIYKGILFKKPNDVDNIAHFHGITQKEIRKGKIKREPCGICGELNSWGHHEYYSDTKYKIRWLCPKHHSIIHTIFRKIDNTKNCIEVYSKMLKENPKDDYAEMSVREAKHQLEYYKNAYHLTEE